MLKSKIKSKYRYSLKYGYIVIKMSFKVSIIMPVYNAEENLKRSIDSIIQQSIGFENIELLLIDDASTDNSGKIITEYCDKYLRSPSMNTIHQYLDEMHRKVFHHKCSPHNSFAICFSNA